MATEKAVKLPTQVWQHIVQLGVERHIQELESQLLEAQLRIAEYEDQHGMSFARLQEVGLPPDADLEAHEAYVEWSSWEGYQAELQERLEELRAVLESADGWFSPSYPRRRSV
ncbi:MAG: hypothetical protein ISS56_16135 [Anaerolineae bacterium]|nr:hypothetical protein [Anaerolineae bacterium]